MCTHPACSRANKNDQIDARKLADLLRANMLKAVYHNDSHTLRLKEVGRSFRSLTDDAYPRDAPTEGTVSQPGHR